jgi:hypothetical protein
VDCRAGVRGRRGVSPANDSRPGSPPGPASKISATTKQLDQDQRSRSAARLAVGEWYAPCGRRHLGVVIVRTCPACQHLHLHRSATPDSAHGAVRTGSCGAAYVLTVRVALPVGIPHAQRRWTA